MFFLFINLINSLKLICHGEKIEEIDIQNLNEEFISKSEFMTKALSDFDSYKDDNFTIYKGNDNDQSNSKNEYKTEASVFSSDQPEIIMKKIKLSIDDEKKVDKFLENEPESPKIKIYFDKKIVEAVRNIINNEPIRDREHVLFMIQVFNFMNYSNHHRLTYQFFTKIMPRIIDLEVPKMSEKLKRVKKVPFFNLKSNF
ncbi:hypothetical protein DMUE_0660 [Dictyocoela muelleri]|nr:hypothetical protein DMUE_0660 [Dictyocoela muelleri]